MYQPAHLDSFIRLLVTHLGSVLTQAEHVKEWQSPQVRMDLLQEAIEHGEDVGTYQTEISQQRDQEALFALQMSQSREWVDRLGQLDPGIERITDEFLAATFAIEQRLTNRQTRKTDYQLENNLVEQGNDNVLSGELQAHLDIDSMTVAIYEFLGRLEEHYDLVEELLYSKMVVNGVPFGSRPANQSADIIPLFSRVRNALHQDNDKGDC